MEQYQELAFTICEVAVEDYKKALKNNDRQKIHSLERFFMSDTWILFTGGMISGQAVIEEVRRQWATSRIISRATGGH